MRYLLTKIIYVVYFLSLSFLSFSQYPEIAIGQWRTHLPYKNGVAIVEGDDEIFCATLNAVFSYGLSDNAINRYDKGNGLSDVGVSAIAYSPKDDILAIAYSNSNIDLLIGNNVVNISDLKRANIAGKKDVNNIHINGDIAYMACGFGILAIDMKKQEVKDTYWIGDEGDDLNVNDVTSTSEMLFAATDQGVKSVSLSASNLADFNVWLQYDTANGIPNIEVQNIVNLDEFVYALTQGSVYKFDGSSWSSIYNDTINDLTFLQSNTSSLSLIAYQYDSTGEIERSAILLIDESGQLISEYTDGALGLPQQVIQLSNQDLWIADLRQPLLRLNDGGAKSITPQGPGSSNVKEMVSVNQELLIAPGSVTNSWNPGQNYDGFFKFAFSYWGTNTGFNIKALDSMFNFIAVAKNPSNNHVFWGSYGGGLLETHEDQAINVYKSNSSLQPMTGDPNSYRVAGLAFDEASNLWVANYGAPEPLSVKKPDDTWISFKPPFSWTENSVGQIVIDDFNQKWVLLAKREGIMVFDHGDDLDDKSDDQYKRMASGLGSGGLPTVNVNCIAKDLDGEIWAGTDEGIAVFYCPGEVFSGDGCDASQILVEIDGVNVHLLETEVVRTIAVDGADRKWIGTTNGVWLLSSDGTETIQYFNEDNSPLLSNIITDIAIDGTTGEVYIGTDKGIISYKGTATEGEYGYENVMVYPNPVREDYTGTIAIRGLTPNAPTKITDVNGTLFYETIANGGQATWDGNNYNGIRAKTGVYLVFITDETGRESFVTKLLIVN